MSKLNKRQQALDCQKLDQVLARFDLHTDNYVYYTLALTHSTYANENKTISNERIEFLGDSLLGMATAEYIYDTFPDMLEGKMTKLRATYVCEDANFSYSKELHLDELLLLGIGEEASGGRNKKAVVADTFESFLGATYKTFGIEAVKKILEEIVFPHIRRIDNEQFVDYKTRLQEYVQADTTSKLEYVVLKEEGKPNEKKFTMAVKLDGIILGIGTGSSKKGAGQVAAKDALERAVKY